MADQASQVYVPGLPVGERAMAVVPLNTDDGTVIGGGASATKRLISSAASNNATVVKAAAGRLYSFTGYNANAAARYLKFYAKATAPDPAADAALLVWTEYLAPQAKFPVSFPDGLAFDTGISFALVTGNSDTDNTGVGAGEILGLNIAYA